MATVTFDAGQAHALALAALKSADVTFWSAWSGDQFCDCGALKSLSASSGEVKSMRTRLPFQRQGVGQAILNEIILTARHRGYTHLFLETGTGAPFAAAHAFYLCSGFTWCGPFADYESTDFNVFMVKLLSRPDALVVRDGRERGGQFPVQPLQFREPNP